MKNLVSAREKEAKKSRHLMRNHGKHSILRRFLWFFLLVCAISISAYYSAVFTVWAEFAQKSFFNQGTITRHTLDNNMVVLIKENHTVALSSLFLCVNSGSAKEGKLAGSGISHFIEHMLFKGTKNRARGDIFKEIESCGGTINAFTSYDYTGYKVTVPSDFNDLALDILADMGVNASFKEEEFDNERKVILNEIRMNQDDPQRVLYRRLWETAYKKHPYKHPILGKEKRFKKLNRDTLFEYYQNNYTPENMVLCVVGDVNTEQFLNKCKNAFKDFTRTSKAIGEILQEPAQKKLQTHDEKFTNGLTYLALGYRSVSIRDKDLYALDVLGSILGKGESSRFYEKICREEQLVYNIEALNYTPQYPGLFIITSHLEEENRKKTLSSIERIIEEIKRTNVQEKELISAKNKIISDALFYNQTLEAQARDMGLNEILTKNHRFTEEYIDHIDRVTIKDVTLAAKKYLNQENLNIVALTPKGKTKSRTPRRFKPYKLGIENLSREEQPLSAENQPLATALDKKIEVNKKDESTKTLNNIQKFTLDNGITLLIQENKDLPLVSVKTAFKGGLRAETESTNGICNLVVKLLDKGTTTKDAQDIAYLIESKGARISSFSGNNSFFVSLGLLSRDLDELLTLYADLITNSVFAEHEIELQKEKNLAKLTSQKDSIFETGKLQLKETLFQKHPFGLNPVGNKYSLDRITRSEIIDFYQTYCVGSNMVLSVFGDVNAQVTYLLVKELFADMKPGTSAVISPPLESDDKTSLSITQQMPKRQSLVLLGFPGTTVYEDDRFKLEVISQLLSQSSGRLFNAIRENAGDAYTLGAYQILGLDPGYIIIYVATTKENTKKVEKEVLRQLTKLKAETLSKNEIAQIKLALIAEKLISRQTNSSRALESTLNELYGLGYNHHLEYTNTINSLTSADIKECARKYFDLNKCVTIIIESK